MGCSVAHEDIKEKAWKKSGPIDSQSGSFSHNLVTNYNPLPSNRSQELLDENKRISFGTYTKRFIHL